MPQMTRHDLGAEERIVVVPVEGGWSVQAANTGLSLMFLSGARAEEQAKSLGRVIAAAGRDTKVLIHDRSTALVAAIRYFAEEAADDAGARPAGG